MKNHKKAFSLIELLIVITIIGILVVAFLPSITSGPSRARDVQRQADLADVALALELYYQDNGSYPAAVTDDAVGNLGIGSYFDSGNLPTDPIDSRPNSLAAAGEYFYDSCNSQQSYLLAANTENVRSTDGYFNMSAYAGDCGATALTPGQASDTVDNNFYVIFKN